MLKAREIGWALFVILAAAIVAASFTGLAYAARGGGHGGGGGGHGGGFHGGGFHGGGFHGGGFHGGGFRGGFHGGGFHGGGVHAFRAAPRMGRGDSARRFQFHSAGPRNAPVSHGLAAGRHVPSSRAILRNASAVNHSLSSRRIRTALHTTGGLRNPMTRAAITTAAAGAVLSHHNGGLWWRHAHGGYGWVGPVFWPYAYYDLYDYAWWGGDYDPFFWDYGYGDLYAGLFGLYDYGALSGYADYLPGYAGPRQASTATGTTTTAIADMCGSDSPDIAGFPVEQFRTAVQPNSEQDAALDDLASASQKASETIRNSCPKDVALTAPGRLAQMQQRVQAMRDAANILKPALDKFYGLLSDDQKARVTALAADHRPPQPEDVVGSTCNAGQPEATNWPGDLIERNVKPTDAQRANLKALQDAATKAADILESSCPPADARTPPARLAAVQTRLDSMLQAIGTVRPALDSLYSSLNDEQKVAFDAIGPERNGIKTATAADETPQRHRHRHHYGYRGMIFRMMGL
jgi:hypothetical protein